MTNMVASVAGKGVGVFKTSLNIVSAAGVLGEVVTAGCFSRFPRPAETPFTMILEARL
jgi:hypothetical protein